MSASIPIFSFQSLTVVVKVWSSSSMRRTCPKKSSRSLQPVSSQSFPPQPSSPARVPGRKRNGGYNKRRNDNRKRHTTFDFDFFSFRFRDRSACPMLRIPWGGFKRYATFTVDATTASGQPVRFFFLVRTTTATRPAWFPSPISHRFAPAFQSSLSRIRFPRMTIAQRTTLEPVTPLSNSEALAMPRTPTTTCTFPTPGCPPLYANSSRHPGTEGTSMDIA